MNYTGVIIEESLVDNSVLDEVKILSTDVEPVTKDHKTPWVSQWTLHTVEVPEENAAEIAEKVSQALDNKHSWYADYKTETDHYIIYRNRVFHVTDRSDKDQYKKATEYGISIGIPPYQVDFSPNTLKWER